MVGPVIAMRKAKVNKAKIMASDGLDLASPQVMGMSKVGESALGAGPAGESALEAGPVSESTLAFYYGKDGTVKEFLATSEWWEELTLGSLINNDLANGYTPERAMAILEGRVDLKEHADLEAHATLISQSMIAEYPLWTAPAQVPIDITVPRGRRTFKKWMTQNGYRWAVKRDSRKVGLVTRGNRPVKVPEHLRPAFQELASKAETVWGPAVAYISLPANQLQWAEAIQLKVRGARLLHCKQGHSFVWIGRRTKRWCEWHERERDALETRYARASQTEKKSLLPKLERLGLRKGSQVGRTIQQQIRGIRQDAGRVVAGKLSRGRGPLPPDVVERVRHDQGIR